jgi:hypothetical protein
VAMRDVSHGDWVRPRPPIQEDVEKSVAGMAPLIREWKVIEIGLVVAAMTALPPWDWERS